MVCAVRALIFRVIAYFQVTKNSKTFMANTARSQTKAGVYRHETLRVSHLMISGSDITDKVFDRTGISRSVYKVLGITQLKCGYFNRSKSYQNAMYLVICEI